MIALASWFPAHIGWTQQASYSLVVFLILILALGGIALLFRVAGKFFPATGKEKRLPQPSSPQAAQTREIPGPVLAAISAAVSVALEGRHFVVYDVSTVGPGAWSGEGRRAIYDSHTLR